MTEIYVLVEKKKSILMKLLGVFLYMLGVVFVLSAAFGISFLVIGLIMLWPYHSLK